MGGLPRPSNCHRRRRPRPADLQRISLVQQDQRHAAAHGRPSAGRERLPPIPLGLGCPRLPGRAGLDGGGGDRPVGHDVSGPGLAAVAEPASPAHDDRRGPADRSPALSGRHAASFRCSARRGCFPASRELSAAIIYLFSHQLLQLDRRQVIHLTKGKTNRQYLREIGRPPLRQLLTRPWWPLRTRFRPSRLDRWRFEGCWSRLPEFESLLAGGPTP